MDYEQIKYEIKNGILTITLNRPEIGNAASDAMAVELTRLLLGAGESSEIVVLRGAGDDLAPNEVICPVCKVVIRSSRELRPGDRFSRLTLTTRRRFEPQVRLLGLLPQIAGDFGERQILFSEDFDRLRQIVCRSFEVCLLAQIGAEFQLNHIDLSATMAAVGLRRVAADIATFMIIGRSNAITFHG